MSNKAVGDRLDEILEAFRQRLQPDSIDVFENMALIATVGHRMSYRPGVSAKLFNALGEAKVNIRMIDQGSSEMNIIVGVENKDFEKAIKAIYNAFVEEEQLMKKLVTISREYGSGGRIIGKILAEKLGVPFYDKEIIDMAVQESGFSREMIESAELKAKSSFAYNLASALNFSEGMSSSPLSVNEKLFLAQFQVIAEI